MRHLLILLLTAICIVMTTTASSAAPPRTRPIEEGHLAAGVEGRVMKDAEQDYWQFVPAQTITDGTGILPAAKGVFLLPSSVLEQLVQLAGNESSVEVRLWAMVTEYRGQNYLYALYFLPLKAPRGQVPPEPDAPKEQPAEKESVLPDEILQMMQRNRVPDLKRLDEIAVVSEDRSLIHRTGLLQADDEGLTFTLDAFGRNVVRETYRLLPTRTLERTQRAMQQTPGRQRYVVSGVLTEFHGQTYLLLRRAVRTYTHGNFTP